MKQRLLILTMAAMMLASPLVSVAQAFEPMRGDKELVERDHDDRRPPPGPGGGGGGPGYRPTPSRPGSGGGGSGGPGGGHRPPPPEPIRPPHRPNHDRDHDRDGGSGWVAAGILGALAVGSIIAGSSSSSQPNVVYAEPQTYYANPSSGTTYYQMPDGTLVPYQSGAVVQPGTSYYYGQQPTTGYYYDANGNLVQY